MLNIIFLGLFLFSHDTPIVNYHLYVDTEDWGIVIEMDEKYLELITDSDDDKIINSKVGAYFSDHFSLSMNGQEIPWEVKSYDYGDTGHVEFSVDILSDNFLVENIEVANSSFLDIIEDHINNIFIYQKDKEVRGFKMDSERQRIQVSL